MTIAAKAALQQAEVVIGYQGYIEQVRPLLNPAQTVHALPIGQEMARAQQAIELAEAGQRVALVSSGDIGVYAMAGPVFERLRAQAWTGRAPSIQLFPGISALQAVAARLGAPISHDFCAISLSDLLTPWPVIERRVQAASIGDFVIAFYNPRSRERHWQLEEALKILAAHRAPETPVTVARNVMRQDEQITLTTLAAVDVTQVDMFTLVLVGNSQSYVVGGRLATPRGYKTTPTDFAN
jgi:cobalt-precorrin 5A hydrolase/precorrin-3B C17-methyltransferase